MRSAAPLARLAALLLPIWAGSGCQARSLEGLSQVHAAAIRDSVETTLDRFRQHSNAGRWDSLAALYADDPGFRWVENGEVRYRSVTAIREALAALPPRTRIETTYQDTEITPLAPGVASVVTRFQTRFTDTTGSGFGFGGIITMTLTHRPEGWKIQTGHTSSPSTRNR